MGTGTILKLVAGMGMGMGIRVLGTVGDGYKYLGGAEVGRRTGDRKVASSTPGRGAIK